MDFSGEERLQEARFLDCKQVQEGTATSQTSKQVNWPVAACAAASCRINISNICIYIYGFGLEYCRSFLCKLLGKGMQQCSSDFLAIPMAKTDGTWKCKWDM